MKIKTFFSIVSFIVCFILMSYLSFAENRIKGKNELCVSCEETGSCNNSSIDLMFFELSKGKGHVVLEWATTHEKNNDHFNIYSSRDGYNFEYVKRIDGQGNTEHSSTYKAIVNTPKSGKYYYYIEQVDFDGTTESFVPEMVEMRKSN